MSTKSTSHVTAALIRVALHSNLIPVWCFGFCENNFQIFMFLWRPQVHARIALLAQQIRTHKLSFPATRLPVCSFTVPRVLVVVSLSLYSSENMSIYYFYCRKFMFFRFSTLSLTLLLPSSHVKWREIKKKLRFYHRSRLTPFFVRQEKNEASIIHFVIINYLECEHFLSASTTGHDKKFRHHKPGGGGSGKKTQIQPFE